MPDVAMCKSILSDGSKCPLRNDCYRYRARPDEMQIWMDAPFKDGYCHHQITSKGWSRMRSIEECEKSDKNE